MPESEEDKKKRWAAAAAMAYMTPSMKHALSMSKQQSQNKYKEVFDKTKGTGFTSVASTPEIENAKKQSSLVSQKKYKSDFEKNKAKFTSVADDPETKRVSRVGKQISDLEYQGKKPVNSRPKRKKDPATSSATSSSQKKLEETSSPDANPVLEHTQLAEKENDVLPQEDAKEQALDYEFDAEGDETSQHSEDNQSPEPSNQNSYVIDDENEDVTALNGDNYGREEEISQDGEDSPVAPEEQLPQSNEPTDDDVEEVTNDVGGVELDDGEKSVEPGENSLDDFYANLG